MKHFSRHVYDEYPPVTRFEQVRPTLVFSVDAVVYANFSSCWRSFSRLSLEHRYNAKVHPHLPKLDQLLRGLSERANLNPKVVIIRNTANPADDSNWSKDWTSFDDFVKIGQGSKLGRTPSGDVEWVRLPFDWPLWILFSSGTTGTPQASSSRAYFGSC